jgi:hypothetical protein
MQLGEHGRQCSRLVPIFHWCAAEAKRSPLTEVAASRLSYFKASLDSRMEVDVVKEPTRKKVKITSMNSLFVIHPYKQAGVWAFDDPEVGLVREPFVAGADVIIDHMVAEIPHAEAGVTIIFSTAPFPGSQHEFHWRREESGGNWYFSPQYELEGWLCPALFKYFERAPAELYVQVKPKSGSGLE